MALVGLIHSVLPVFNWRQGDGFCLSFLPLLFFSSLPFPFVCGVFGPVPGLPVPCRRPGFWLMFKLSVPLPSFRASFETCAILEKMVTKGVASVRSPVCNLQQHNARITHEDFTNVVINEFRNEYSIGSEVCYVGETREVLDDPDIRNGMEELKSWEWQFGQTPEFTYDLERVFPWGRVTLQLRSKHGVVLDCAPIVSDLQNPQLNADQCVHELASSLVGQRYGFFRFGQPSDHSHSQGTIRQELEAWIVNETS
ncbi:hypothetical protein CC2G_009964 [Coprinopsis cinerea AmutBmut pab1-1]|nr:hypothetical protein CC2G_009964 [Coprinopsis cinerea AmutBmut pab1-1]